MEWTDLRSRLRAILCDLFPREGDVRIILDDAGVDTTSVDWSTSTQMIWHHILGSLHSRRQLGALLEEVLKRNPQRDDLRETISQYQHCVAGSGLSGSLFSPGTPSVPDLSAALAPAGQEQNLASLAALGLIVAQAQGLNPDLFRASSVSFDPPPLPSRLARRHRTVQEVHDVLTRGECAVLTGEALTGKTVLACLVLEIYKGRSCWIRLSGTESERASYELDIAVSALAGPAPLFDRRPWYSYACQRLGADSLVVIDDLPIFETGEQFGQKLSAFATSCQEHGVRLVATTSTILPRNFNQSSPGFSLTTFPVPPLERDDVAELLRSWGAPDEFVSQAARLVHLMCRQHPFIINAACEYLRHRVWKLGDEEFDALLGDAPAESIILDVDRRLRRTVTDSATRELLYRLALVRGRFRAVIADAVAAVSPARDRPHERLADLTGHWVKELGGGIFEVSPLISKLAEQRLSEKHQIECHRRIGLALINRRFDQNDAANAISHFHRAGEFDRAGSLLFLVLAAMLRETRELPDDPIFSVWSSMELPIGMDLNLRLMIRAVQIEIAKRRNKPIDYTVADLSRLANEAGSDHHYGLKSAAVYMASRINASTMGAALIIIRKLQSLPNYVPEPKLFRRGKGDEERKALEGLTIDRLLLTLVVGINSPQDLFDWLESVLRLPEADRERLFVPEGMSLLFPAADDILVAKERKKPKLEQDWDLAFKAIKDFGDRSLSGGCEELWASSIRSRINILAGEQGRLDEAISLARTALLRCSNRPLPRLLIGSGIGESLLHAGRNSEAIDFLCDAVRLEPLPHYYETMSALLSTSRAVGDADPSDAVDYARRASQVAAHFRMALPLEEVRSLGELALARYFESGGHASFSDWDRAFSHLLEVRNESDSWKDLFVVFGHVAGFVIGGAAKGAPPSTIKTGEEYSPPCRGMFMSENRERLEYFSEENVLVIPYLMTQYALAVEDYSAVTKWTDRFNATGAAGQLPLLRAGLYRDQVAHLLLHGDVSRAINQAHEAARILVALSGCRLISGIGKYGGPEVDSIASGLTGDDAAQADSLAVKMAVFPAVLRTATLHSQKDQSSSAQAYAQLVVGSCRSQSPDGPGREYWNSVTTPIELAFNEGRRFAELLRWKESQENLAPERAAIIYIALAANATPEEAIGVLLPIMPTLEKWYEPGGLIHRLILLPYLETYWLESFARMRFRFACPALVERQLHNALQAPEDLRVRAILKAVLSGFQGSPPAALASWLDGKPL